MIKTLSDIYSDIDALMRENREARDLHREIRIMELRREAGVVMCEKPDPARVPMTSVSDVFEGCEGLPEVARNELSAETLASGVQHHGALIVRGLYNKPQTDHLLEMALSRPELPPAEENFMFARANEAFDLIRVFEDSGMLDTVRAYHGGKSVIMEQRLKLRRQSAKHATGEGLPWHQDINYFGKKSHAINCWAAVTPCGVDNPGLNFIPRRNETSISWDPAKGQQAFTYIPQDLRATVEDFKKETPEVAVKFQPGDAVFFDEMTLHRTGVMPYKIPEQIITVAWLFNPAFFPDNVTPLAV